MDKIKPRIFIASSVEGLDAAYAIQELLEFSAECTVWDQDVFAPSSVTLLDLIKRAQNSDYGIFVFSFDDTIKIRDTEELTVRDNVVFELGLFIGIIGIANCFIVMPRSKMHNTLPFGSAIILDGNLESGRIQIETKPYKVGMRKSFAFEIINDGNSFYDTIKSSYYELIHDGDCYENSIE